MRPSTGIAFLNALVLIPFVQAASTLTLSTFQPINGFDTACTNAYNTPLTDCSNSDFSGQGCSAKCIGFLDDLTKSLIEDCAGTSAYHTTLIGLFFANEGVQTLCSNAGESSSSSGGGNGNRQSGGQDGAYGTQSAAGEASASTTSTSTITSSTSTPQAAAATSPSSTPQAAATSSTTIDVATTVTPEPTTTSVAVVGTTVTPESPSDASSSTSPTKSSTSSSSTSTSTNSGNGGGTPLDTGSSACHGAAVSMWLFALLTGSAGAAWLL